MYTYTSIMNMFLFGTAIATPFAVNGNPHNLTMSIERRCGRLTPVMGGQNFPDPSLIRVGNDFYAFGTNGHVNGKLVHIQMAHSSDFDHWTFNGGQDALPDLPAWVDKANPRVWAPDVVQLSSGSFVMYYSAAAAKYPGKHCIGVATSKSVQGPYKPTSDNAWTCNIPKGGSIDAAGYTNSDGTRWVVYKIDGNSIGHGGSCGNTVALIVPTPIVLQQVASDGHTLIGTPTELIRNGPADGPYVEAPSLTKMPDGTFVLFFSSNCFVTPKYDVSYATAKDIRGPYTKYGPMIVTGDDGLVAPGGLDIAINGERAVFHANWGNGRAMFTAFVGGSGNDYDAYVRSA